jgi:hypothetical protein
MCQQRTSDGRNRVHIKSDAAGGVSTPRKSHELNSCSDNATLLWAPIIYREDWNNPRNPHRNPIHTCKSMQDLCINSCTVSRQHLQTAQHPPLNHEIVGS